MAERHKWADAIIAWANGEAIQYSYERQGWQTFTGEQPDFWSDRHEWRIKPRTIKIGDMEVPEPLRELPECGEAYYVASANHNALCLSGISDETGGQNIWVKRRLVHLTRADAVAHAKALIAVSGGTV